MVTRPEFAEIPSQLRSQIDEEVRADAFDLLHAEAVERGDLPAPPKTYYDRAPGRLLKILLQISIGGVVGLFATIVCLVMLRSLTTIL